MLELLLIVTLLICGSVFGALLGGTTGISAIVVLLAFVGGCLGTLLAYTSLGLIKRSATNEPLAVQPVREPKRVQTNFRARLANYLKIPEQEILLPDPFKSTMSFWSRVSVFWRRTTRTPQEIRATLLRIQELLSSSR